MPLHDASYKHWDGIHLGIWSRRGVIALNGLKGCLQGKWMRQLIMVCWVSSLVQISFLFLIGQLLVPDSVAVQWLANLNPALQTFARGLVVWLTQHPEISVRTTYNMLFYYFSTTISTFSLIAIALALPHLITRDLSSNAIIVYSSKAVARFDYLLGKFATVFGLLTLTWLGPLCAAWFMGNLLAPDWHFFWHSRVALRNILLYVLASMTILSILALGVSAISAKEKSTVSLWIALWLLGNAFVPIGMQSKAWLKYFSFSFDLQQLALAVFRLTDDLKLAQDNIPVFGEILKGIRRQTWSVLQNPEVGGAVCGLAVMVAMAVFIIARKVKPE